MIFLFLFLLFFGPPAMFIFCLWVFSEYLQLESLALRAACWAGSNGDLSPSRQSTGLVPICRAGRGSQQPPSSDGWLPGRAINGPGEFSSGGLLRICTLSPVFLLLGGVGGGGAYLPWSPIFGRLLPLRLHLFPDSLPFSRET